MRRLCLAMLLALLAVPATASAVVGGRAATQPYPSMAAVEYDGAGAPSEYEFVCGASLVAADRLLTAGHCVVDDRDGDGDLEVVPPQTLRFLIGTQRLDQRSAGETIGAAEIMLHEKFLDDEQGGHDVAIVRLARSATKGSPIRIAAPPAEKPLWAPGRQATVTGWGVVVPGDPGVTVQDQLQEIQIPMRSDDECELSYFGTIDPATMVCAGELQGGEDSCAGDSGGPLMVPDATGALVQAGIVSFGNGCGFPTQYGVYSRIGDTVLYDWIARRVPQPAPPPPAPEGGGSGGGTGSGGGGGSGGGTSGGGSSGGSSGSTSPSPSPARRGSRAHRRCMARASRVRGITARRRAVKRCQYAERRRVAYRRCIRRGTPRKRCRAKRRAAARRHARLVKRTR